MVIGAAWEKTSQNGVEYLSCQISIPFLGKINFSMFKNNEKKSENSPDYSIVWSDAKKKSGNSVDNQPDNDIPF